MQLLIREAKKFCLLPKKFLYNSIQLLCFRIDAEFVIAEIIVLTLSIFISGICILFSVLTKYCNVLVPVCICFAKELPTCIQ